MGFGISRPLRKRGRKSVRARLLALCAESARADVDCARNVLNLVTRRRGGTFYPDEIGVQKTHTKHRKLDSQATLPHPTRDRAADGLRPKAWPLRAPRCDHDPGRLPPWPAGLRGLRPAMAADRAVRGPPPRSPCQEWNPQRPPNPR